MTTGPGHWEGNLTHICYVNEINQSHAFGWCGPTDPCSQVIIILFVLIQIFNLIVFVLVSLDWDGFPNLHRGDLASLAPHHSLLPRSLLQVGTFLIIFLLFMIIDDDCA